MVNIQIDTSTNPRLKITGEYNEVFDYFNENKILSNTELSILALTIGFQNKKTSKNNTDNFKEIYLHNILHFQN